MRVLDEIVSVTNEGTEPFVGMHLGQKIVIGPGETADIVHRAAAILWFGDPSKIDHVKDGKDIDDRTRECERLDARYGIFSIRRDEMATTPPRTREDAWPRVRVFKVNGKETYRMVVNDPEGSDLQPQNETKGERSLLLREIDEMKQRLERYEAQAARGIGEGEAPSVDTPTQRRGKSA